MLLVCAMRQGLLLSVCAKPTLYLSFLASGGSSLIGSFFPSAFATSKEEWDMIDSSGTEVAVVGVVCERLAGDHAWAGRPSEDARFSP